MSLHSNLGGGEAVIFFSDDGERPREMLYSEFEAILDAVVGLPEFINQTKRAVYLRINGRLKITAAVFFTIPFDDKGEADKNWNIPLQHLADNSGKGPDLGGGPIRLACRSQCSIEWHQKQLWDPQLGGEAVEFNQLVSIVRDNRLGIILSKNRDGFGAGDPSAMPGENRFTDDYGGGSQVGQQSQRFAQSASEPVSSAAKQNEIPILQSDLEISTRADLDSALLSSGLNEEFLEENLRLDLTRKISSEYQLKLKEKMAGVLKEHRLEMDSLVNQQNDQLNAYKVQHQRILAEYMEQLEDIQLSLKQERDKNSDLKSKLQAQAAEAHAARELFEDEMSEARNIKAADLESIKQQFSLEVKTNVEAETATLKEMLKMREIELYYRHEQEISLRDAALQLRAEKAELINEGVGSYVEKLHDSGITFVAYHSGSGHITIPSEDMGVYLENIGAYAAERCGVSLDLYKEWLSHFESPCCQADNNGQLCGVEIDQVEHPNQFVHGVSNRCKDHIGLSGNGDSEGLSASEPEPEH